MNIMCWLSFIDGSTPSDVSAEFHFNYWPKTISNHKERQSYLDIGAMLTNYNNVDSLIFWLPNAKSELTFNTRDNFEDLGKHLKDNQTATLIFNEILKTSTDAQKPKQTVVTSSQKQSEFIVYELSEDNIKAQSEYEGFTLRISLRQLLKQGVTSPIYIRFRLMGQFLKDMERKIEVKNKLLQSAFTETSYIDFRFNDIRSCNHSLQEHLLDKNHLKITKVHFLLMARSNEEVTASESITARILEPKAWETYLGHEIGQICVAHHWRFKATAPNCLENCIIYARYKVQQCNGGTIALYILILFLLTVSMNLTSSIIYGYMQTWFPAIFP